MLHHVRPELLLQVLQEVLARRRLAGGHPAIRNEVRAAGPGQDAVEDGVLNELRLDLNVLPRPVVAAGAGVDEVVRSELLVDRHEGGLGRVLVRSKNLRHHRLVSQVLHPLFELLVHRRHDRGAISEDLAEGKDFDFHGGAVDGVVLCDHDDRVDRELLLARARDVGPGSLNLDGAPDLEDVVAPELHRLHAHRKLKVDRAVQQRPDVVVLDLVSGVGVVLLQPLQVGGARVAHQLCRDLAELLLHRVDEVVVTLVPVGQPRTGGHEDLPEVAADLPEILAPQQTTESLRARHRSGHQLQVPAHEHGRGVGVPQRRLQLPAVPLRRHDRIERLLHVARARSGRIHRGVDADREVADLVLQVAR